MARRRMVEDSQHAMFASQYASHALSAARSRKCEDADLFASISRSHAERSASLGERASAHAEKRATKATDAANACRRK